MKTTYLAIVLFLSSLFLSVLTRAEVPADAVWIDVRTPAEFQQGHLPQAIHIPYDGIEKGVAILELPKDTPIYLYCAAGGRAEKAKQRLEAAEYSAVVNAGGLADARILIDPE